MKGAGPKESYLFDSYAFFSLSSTPRCHVSQVLAEACPPASGEEEDRTSHQVCSWKTDGKAVSSEIQLPSLELLGLLDMLGFSAEENF